MKKKEYKCKKCGLEIVILKPEKLKLPRAGCQDCGTMTMEEIPKDVRI